jgi:phosphatidate cytidylyltransferase
MALNLAILRTRALSAAVFVVVMLVGLLWSPWSFFVLFSIIHFGCWREYQKIIALIDTDYATITPFHRYAVMLAGWCLMLYFMNDHYRIGGVSLHIIGWWAGLAFIFVLPAGEIILSRKLQFKNIGYSFLGLLYISLSWGLLTNLRSSFAGTVWDFLGELFALSIVLSIWINDTMAYIVGSLIGKTPFSKISPGKTWEGTLGGIVLAVLVMGIAGYFLGYKLRNSWEWDAIWPWMIIAVISAIAGTFGDLLESKLKRMAGIKDSGQLMPGHGGFLDRFDSLLLATPFVWLFLAWMMR